MDALRRHPRVWVVIAAFVGIVLTTIILTKQLDTSGGLDGAAVGIAAGTLLLALLGAGLATIAYVQSIRRPLLKVRVWLDFEGLEQPPAGEVRATPQVYKPADMLGYADPFRALSPVDVRVFLENRGDVTARNVTVAVELSGMKIWFKRATMPEGWVVLDRVGDPSYQFQWDGGADLAVHPNPAPARRVPAIHLAMIGADMGATVRAAAVAYADGCKPTDHTFEIRAGERNPDGTTPY
jgi:hypothetical protein